MIKTIATYTQTTPNISEEIFFSVLNQNLNQIAIWQTEGKYTGGVHITYNPDTKVKQAERWDWVDNAAAQAYKNLAVSSFIGMYPDVNVDIVVE